VHLRIGDRIDRIDPDESEKMTPLTLRISGLTNEGLDGVLMLQLFGGTYMSESKLQNMQQNALIFKNHWDLTFLADSDDENR